MNIHQELDPNFLRLEPTKQRLTSVAGMCTLLEAFDRSVLKEPFIKCLPERSSNRSQGTYRLGLIQLGSFIYGHDCLADLEQFRSDPVMTEVMRGETVAPRTMGDFLRDFSLENIKDFNFFLSTQASQWPHTMFYGGQLSTTILAGPNLEKD